MILFLTNSIIENAINILKNTERSFLIASYKNNLETNSLYYYNNKNGRIFQEKE